MLGEGGKYIQDCLEHNYIGVNFIKEVDLTSYPHHDENGWRQHMIANYLECNPEKSMGTARTSIGFLWTVCYGLKTGDIVLAPNGGWRQHMIANYLECNPEKSMGTARTSIGFLWTVCYGLKTGDIVLAPNGEGGYCVAEITGNYHYAPNQALPHRRQVQWQNITIPRQSMSKSLQNSTGSIGTCCNITKYAEELEQLISNEKPFIAPVVQAKKEMYKERSLHRLLSNYLLSKSIYSKTIFHENSSKSEKPFIAPVVQAKKEMYKERSLHRLLSNYLLSKSIYSKTIFHENSSKSADQAQKWVHPDMVGVEYNEFQEAATRSLLKAAETKEYIALYSYELKRTIENDHQLKEYFFQALSNSSWANYGYLVAFEINEDLMEEIARLNRAFGIGIIQLSPYADATKELFPARRNELDYYTIEINEDLMEEIARLNRAFGIGIIQLSPYADATKELFPARRNELDYYTIDKLCRINSDYKNFIIKATKVINAQTEVIEDVKGGLQKFCDKGFSIQEDIIQYCNENHIPC